MARIPPAHRDTVPASQLDAFDEYVAQRGSIPDTGPLSVLINVPELIKRGEHLRAYLRGDESSLPVNLRELAMLVTAREMDCQFIWNAHAGMGRQSGLNDSLVNNLRDKQELAGLSAEESAVVDYGREFFRTHRVSQSTFDRGLSLLGMQGLIELTNLMGYYSCLAFNINAFEVGLPAEITEAPLPV